MVDVDNDEHTIFVDPKTRGKEHEVSESEEELFSDQLRVSRQTDFPDLRSKIEMVDVVHHLLPICFPQYMYQNGTSG
jgi:hypothetical protein